MSRRGWNRLAGGLRAGRVVAWVLAFAAAPWSLRAQPPVGPAVGAPAMPVPPGEPIPFVPNPGPTGPAPVVVTAPGTATTATAPVPAAPVIPPEVQVVRFSGPEGIKLEVLGPPTEPVPTGDGRGLATVGLKVGLAYRLRLTNLPDHPGEDLYPIIEVVGHLHRPPGIDPAKYPIRVIINGEDIADVVDRGRMVTQVIYLEDQDQAIPQALPKDEIPALTLSPVEDPLRVAMALGRPMAIVRLGGRKPTADEVAREEAGEVGLGSLHCPFISQGGSPCPLLCGPVRGAPSATGRPWLPRDEYLCDGGDHAEPAHIGVGGAIGGIDPRDAVLGFSDNGRPRVLPTNVVCIYAPRFAMVRTTVGVNENLIIESPLGAEIVQREQMMQGRQPPRRFTQHQAAQLERHRSRASGMIGRVYTGQHSEIRVLDGFENVTHLAAHIRVQRTEVARNRQKAGTVRNSERLVAIKTGAAPVVTGIVESASQVRMAWKPQETAGVEVPPNRLGLGVFKQVNATEAEPGDTVTFTIRYRNLGNVPIRSVSIIDSLMPRLEYVPQSAQGPAGSVFSAGENRAGAMELRWDLPGAIPPGGEGFVSFRALVR